MYARGRARLCARVQVFERQCHFQKYVYIYIFHDVKTAGGVSEAPEKAVCKMNAMKPAAKPEKVASRK